MLELNKLSEETEKLLSSAPDVYNDLAKPAVQQAGKLLSFPLEFINALLARPRLWIANANYKLQETNILIAKKLENISVDKIKTPEDYIAIPALQALSYSMDSEELREMYANLLAKAMNTDTAQKVHPAFIDIIKQLSPLDANIFNIICSNEDKCIVTKDICLVKSQVSYDFSDMLTPINLDDVEVVSSSIYNLLRLGLLMKFDKQHFRHELYKNIDNNPKVKKYINKIKCNEIKDPINEKIILSETGISTSSFGDIFYSICCQDINLPNSD